MMTLSDSGLLAIHRAIHGDDHDPAPVIRLSDLRAVDETAYGQPATSQAAPPDISASLRKRFGDAIAHGKFSMEALHQACVTAASTKQSLETVLGAALDNADLAAATLVSHQMHRAWQPPAAAPASAPGRGAVPARPAPLSAATPVPPKIVTESERQAIIDRATLPGCEALAARLKADPSIIYQDAALQLLAEHNRVQAAADRSLRAEFPTVESYEAFKRAEASGRVRIHAPGGASRPSAPVGAVNLVEIGDRARQEWRDSAELQREFATADRYATYAQGVATGRIKIYGAAR